MLYPRFSVILFMCLFVAESIAQDTRSLQMSIMDGYQFQCVNTTCLPFATVFVSDIRDCQFICLSNEQCRAATFHHSTSACELFTNASSNVTLMFSQVQTTAMLVIPDTRTRSR